MKPCIDYAMNHIYRFPKTESQLRTQLLKKWYSYDEIEKTIKYLKSKNFVNDKKYVESYFYSECVKKWKPSFVVKWKLFQKWIDKNTINDVFVEMEDDINKWVKNGIKKEIEKYKNKWIDWFDIIQKLTSRWYSIDDIKKVL